MDKAMIIAEAGVNHNGDIMLAKKLIDAAKACGADAIKFQVFKTEQLVTKEARKADYQITHIGSVTTQFDMLKKLELKNQDFGELASYCKVKNIEFIASPFDLESIDILNELHLQTFKIPSGEITNYPYLKKISCLNKSIILSTGMADRDEIDAAVNILKSRDFKDLKLLHCTTEYPAPIESVNLRAMLTLKKMFGLDVGYSDHTKGVEAAIAAVTLGACILEKHLTLDCKMPGPDHKASLEPEQFNELVRSIRNVEGALGNGIKEPTIAELKNREFARKSIVAARDIQKGEVFTEDNLCTKRPGNGISPMRYQEVLGRNADKEYKKDEMIIDFPL